MSQPPPPSPSWETLILVATYLDPKTLAIASCVSKSWFSSMSSDNIWRPILATHFPSLATLPSAAADVAHRRLFAMGHAAATHRLRRPLKPGLSLSDLVFAVSISTREGEVASSVRPGNMLTADVSSLGVFRYSMRCDGAVLREGVEEEVRVTWNVVLRGWRGVFTMMEREGKVGFVAGGEGWFSQELPAPGCCSGAVKSSVAVDLKVVVGEEKSGDGVRVEEVSVGIMSVVDWRYVGVEDGLRYLQHFLLPNNATYVCKNIQ
ncbi:probable F-box protein At5g04010 [Cajanus cajan]|nr:probable F-box protein At5g04010 [Cajanus cajan]